MGEYTVAVVWIKTTTAQNLSECLCIPSVIFVCVCVYSVYLYVCACLGNKAILPSHLITQQALRNHGQRVQESSDHLCGGGVCVCGGEGGALLAQL